MSFVIFCSAVIAASLIIITIFILYVNNILNNRLNEANCAVLESRNRIIDAIDKKISQVVDVSRNILQETLITTQNNNKLSQSISSNIQLIDINIRETFGKMHDQVSTLDNNWENELRESKTVLNSLSDQSGEINNQVQNMHHQVNFLYNEFRDIRYELSRRLDVIPPGLHPTVTPETPQTKDAVINTQDNGLPPAISKQDLDSNSRKEENYGTITSQDSVQPLVEEKPGNIGYSDVTLNGESSSNDDGSTESFHTGIIEPKSNVDTNITPLQFPAISDN